MLTKRSHRVERRFLITTTDHTISHRVQSQKLCTSYSTKPFVKNETINCNYFALKNNDSNRYQEIITPIPRPSVMEIERFDSQSRTFCNKFESHSGIRDYAVAQINDNNNYHKRLIELEYLLHCQEMQNDYLKTNLKKSAEHNLKLLKEVEALLEQLQITDEQMDKQFFHLQNVYFTLYQNGFSKLYLRNDECLHLKDFQGILLALERRNGFDEKERTINNKHASKSLSITNQSTSVMNYNENNSDQILRKLAQLQTERNKIDDYIKWLHIEAKKEVKTSTKTHIYDDPYTGSSSECDELGKRRDTNQLLPKSVHYSNMRTMKIKFSDETEHTRKLRKDLKPDGSSPRKQIRNGRSPSWGSRSSNDLKKRRISRRESFFVNFLEKSKGRRKNLNPFGLGRSTGGSAFQSCPEFHENSRQRLKTHII